MRKVLLVLVAVMAVAAVAQDHRAVPDSAAWKSLQSLVGNWAGTMKEGDKEFPAHVEVRMTGDGSALMHWMAKGTPQEMVTMFYPDLEDLRATHYCAAHNQPRLKMVSSTPKRLVFEFTDGTNIAPHDGHMAGVTINFIDANHHDEEWSYEDSAGKKMSGIVHYARTIAN